MKISLQTIRAKIAELEAKISNLRIAEHELQLLDREPPEKPAADRRPKANGVEREALPRAAVAASQTGPARTIGGAIAEALDPRVELSVAEIAEKLKEGGREIDNRSISFALQALKKKKLAKNGKSGWLAASSRGKAVAKPARPAAKASPKTAAKAQLKKVSAPPPDENIRVSPRLTVADAVSQTLRETGPLPLADLIAALKAGGREVSNGTLSNTLQIKKKRGAVQSADGKWLLP